MNDLYVLRGGCLCSAFDDVDDVTCAWESTYKDILDGYISSGEAKIRKFSQPFTPSLCSFESSKTYFNFDLFVSDAEYLLLKSNWPSISYF